MSEHAGISNSLEAQLPERAGVRPQIAPMSGATSSDLYLLEYPDQRQVLRIFKAERWEAPAAELSLRELTILEALAGTSLPTPLPIDAFSDNGVLMSWLPGAVDLPAAPDQAWLQTLAESLVGIHQSGIRVPFQFESWHDSTSAEPPDWWQSRSLWSEALAATATAPSYEPCFIHRDYHPVNVLREGGLISGIVDWINACMGPVGIDLAHCRLNLAIMYGLDAADGFLRHYQNARPDYRHDAYWDLDDALGAFPDVKVYPPWLEFGLAGLSDDLVRHRLEVFIEAAVRSL